MEQNHTSRLARHSLNIERQRRASGALDRECDHSPHFKELSAVKFDWWPLIVVACRHYRIPLSPHLLEGLKKKTDIRTDRDKPQSAGRDEKRAREVPSDRGTDAD